MHFSIGEPNSEDLAVSEVSRSENEKDLTIVQQRRRLAEVERELQAVYASRSWRITSPLRKAMVGFAGSSNRFAGGSGRDGSIRAGRPAGRGRAALRP